MAEDPEKKFYTILNKLIHSPFPKSTPSSSNVQRNRAYKRPYLVIEASSKSDGSEGNTSAAQAPLCRPWDRGDLMRRVATFKAMRWFAKPKVMDAINCARRGWVNVDMDIIACEACGARLQFSTPSTWSQQQVEKAALVFSLKLDSGHKLLCPWVNNACDETLALFPPLPTLVLVDLYKERSASLLQLSALPVIPVSTIEGMRSTLLDHFLQQSIAVEFGPGPNGSSWTEYLGNEAEAVSADLYYQAHRLLSLCGWEPRSLPYVVDSVEQPKQSENDKDPSYLSHAAAGEKTNKLCVYVSGSGEGGNESEEAVAPVVHYDPNCTVLDCKFCGASIGLWAFRTVPRPLELVRVVGYSQFDSRSNQGRELSKIDNGINKGTNDIGCLNEEATSSKEAALSFSIAGGPPPTKQNFRATISLPVVGRNVRARFSCEALELRNKGHALPNAMEDSVENNLPMIEDARMSCQAVNHSDSQINDVSHSVSEDNVGESLGNDVQGVKSLTIIDDSSELRRRPSDNVVLMKDTSSIPSVCQKDNSLVVANMAAQMDVSGANIETDLRRHLSDQKMEFDPVRQHRYFCPWVASSGTSAPGWHQTLLALQKEKVFLLPESDEFSSSPSLIKVDDPITSIRKLFESPPAKLMKPTST